MAIVKIILLHQRLNQKCSRYIKLQLFCFSFATAAAFRGTYRGTVVTVDSGQPVTKKAKKMAVRPVLQLTSDADGNAI